VSAVGGCEGVGGAERGGGEGDEFLLKVRGSPSIGITGPQWQDGRSQSTESDEVTGKLLDVPRHTDSG
jgi:hypothetical protein